MKQVLICLEKEERLLPKRLTSRQKELVALGISLIRRDDKSIAEHVDRSLDAGVSREDILKIAAFTVGDRGLLDSIIELLRALTYEENRRTSWISVVDDIRE